MNNKYIVTFNRSNEDVPTLVVARESFSVISCTGGIDIVQIITGDEAVDIWNKLGKIVKVEVNHDIR